MTKYHEVSNVKVVSGKLHMTVDGKRYAVDLAAVSPKLASAAPKDQRRVEVSPSGYGLRWPTIDEDLSVDGLVRWCESQRQLPVRKRRTLAK